MPNERQIRELAWTVLRAGTLPRRDPDHTWGGYGVGTCCMICDTPITQVQIEYEIHFVHDRASPRVDRYALHIRCFSAWEMERTKPEK